MRLELDLEVFIELDEDIDPEIAHHEFLMNWCNQVPHWKYLSYDGICFFKELTHLDKCQFKHMLFQHGAFRQKWLPSSNFPCNEDNKK